MGAMGMIYATPFRESDKETTGPSAPSGFESLGQVVQMLGQADCIQRPSMVIYGAGDDRIVYSRVVFRIDAAVNSG